MFSVGKAVEVSFDRQDVWFPATVLEVFENDMLLVEYHKSDVREKVTVDSFHIRPQPPHLKNTNYGLLEKVDASYDYGWRTGVITKMLADGKYVVFFKHFDLEKELDSLELRPHMDWKDGKWYTSSQFTMVSMLNQRTVQLSSSGTTDEASREKISCSLNSQSDRIAQSTDCNEKPWNDTVSPKRKPHSSSANDGSLLQPKLLQKEQISTSSRSLTPCRPNTKEFRTLVDEISCGLENSASEDARRNISTARKNCQKISEQDISVSDVQIVHEKRTRLQAKGTQLPIQGKAAAGNVAENNKTGVPIVLGLKCISLLRSSKINTCVNGKECSDPSSGQKQHVNRTASESEQLSNAEGSQKKKRGRPARSAVNTLKAGSQKKKRGRPTRSAVNTLKAPSTLPDNQQSVLSKPETITKDCEINEYDLLANMGLESTVLEIVSPNNKNDTGLIKGQKEHIKKRGRGRRAKEVLQTAYEKVVHNTIKQPEKQTLKKRKRKTNTVNDKSETKDVPGASEGRNAEHIDVERVITEVSSNSFDDQPLSKWITIDGSRFSSARNMEGHSESSNKSKEIITQTPIDNGNVTVSTELHRLPFDRTPLLWATVESMDVFQRIPQKPHFQPLEHVKESRREGLAIGYMVTFSSVVDKCCRVQLDDPRSTIEETLETLDELENQGFNVHPVRDRLSQIVMLKDKKANLELQSAELDSQIVKHNIEKTEADEEICSIKKQIAELEQKLSLATSGKEAKDVEIASLQSKMDEIKEEIRNARSDYKDLASKPLARHF